MLVRQCALLVLMTALYAAGCGKGSDEPARVIVFGKVSYAGHPIESGEIRFVPAAGTNAPTAGALIEKGAYRMDHKGGVPVGTFQIRVLGYKAPGTGEGDDIPGAPSNDPMAAKVQFLPEAYAGAQSELTITIPQGSPPIEHNLDLEKLP